MAGPPRTVSPSVEFLVSSAAISEAAVPTTVTFVQQVVPTASSLSTAATASSTISYPSGSYASVSIGPGCKVSVCQLDFIEIFFDVYISMGTCTRI